MLVNLYIPSNIETEKIDKANTDFFKKKKISDSRYVATKTGNGALKAKYINGPEVHLGYRQASNKYKNLHQKQNNSPYWSLVRFLKFALKIYQFLRALKLHLAVCWLISFFSKFQKSLPFGYFQVLLFVSSHYRDQSDTLCLTKKINPSSHCSDITKYNFKPFF